MVGLAQLSVGRCDGIGASKFCDARRLGEVGWNALDGRMVKLDALGGEMAHGGLGSLERRPEVLQAKTRRCTLMEGGGGGSGTTNSVMGLTGSLFRTTSPLPPTYRPDDKERESCCENSTSYGVHYQSKARPSTLQVSVHTAATNVVVGLNGDRTPTLQSG